MKTLGLIMYMLLLGFFIHISWIERQDWECPTPHSNSDECDGNGMPHRNSKPNHNDDCQQLLKRIENAAGAERKSVKWRRAFLSSVGITFLLWILLLTPGYLPEWIKFYMSVLIVFVVVRAQFAWYSYHRFKVPEEHIYKALDLLKRCVR